MRSLRNLVVLALLALVAFGGSASPAGAGSDTYRKAEFRKTVFFDMYYQQHVKPRRIFTTANAGPYFKKLKWKNWGKNRTTARGRFISDCASCGEKENKPARIIMRKKIPCKRLGVNTYRIIRLNVIDPDRPNRWIIWRGSCPPPGYDG
jgi:hypothetical protein